MFQTIFFIFQRELYYIKKLISSHNTEFKNQEIDYEKYFLNGDFSNYDYHWIIGGIPREFIVKNFFQDRIDELNKYITLQKHTKILDIGCSDGLFLSELHSHYSCKVYGIDISKEALNVAKKRGILTHQCNLSKDTIPFPDNYFDVILAFDVIEHIQNTTFLFTQLHRILKKNGILYIITPNGKQDADKDMTHFSLKQKNEWESIFKKNKFSILNSWTYDYCPPPPYIITQKILHFFHKIIGFKIKQISFILTKL